MISNVCWHQIKFFQAIDVIKYVVKCYWCKMWFWYVIDPLPFRCWSGEPARFLCFFVLCIGGVGAQVNCCWCWWAESCSLGMFKWPLVQCSQLELPPVVYARGPGDTTAPFLMAQHIPSPACALCSPGGLGITSSEWAVLSQGSSHVWETVWLGCWLVLRGRAGIQLFGVWMDTWRVNCCMLHAKS